MSMTEARQARRARLPQWAQQEIANLERQVQELTAAAKSLAENTAADGYITRYNRVPTPILPVKERIRFPFDGIDGRLWIDVHRQGERELQLMGARPLHIAPQVTNVIQVKLVDR